MQKRVFVEQLDTEVVFARRKGTRHLKLTIKSDGIIRVSVPYGITLQRAERFVIEKSEWIEKHRKQPTILQNGDRVGKSYRLFFSKSATTEIKTRVGINKISVNVPSGFTETNHNVQLKARQAAERALLKQAKQLLPQRLEALSVKHSIPYKKCTVKKLKSRWGSCDNFKNITLSSYLIQLDWKLIDYVIRHELAHTYHPHHQPDFWEFLESIEPNYKQSRKELKAKPTDVLATNL
jgi:predicted metal-dependent hydrolase